MPVVCLTTDPDNLTNEEYGAFAYGPNAVSYTHLTLPTTNFV